MHNLLDGKQNFYFIGVGGVGMSALAKLALHLGHGVRGSDASESRYTKSLLSCDITVDVGHHHAIPPQTTCVVVSSAIPRGNRQFLEARARAVPCVHRSQLLADYLNSAVSVAVTGTHGKTTTTLFTHELLTACGWAPTLLLGGMGGAGHDNFYPGRLDHAVAEVDESDASHLAVSPVISVLTNLEEEHVDTYPDFDLARETMRAYVGGTRSEGAVVYWKEDAALQEVLKTFKGRSVSFGFSPHCDVEARSLEMALAGTRFEVRVGGARRSSIFLPVPGRHNVGNFLAALAAVYALGQDTGAAIAAAGRLAAPARRLELLYEDPERLVVSDYAHHPTEVRAAVESLRLFKKPLTVVFQPHRFSRLARFSLEFAGVLCTADRVVITDVYGAGEPKPQGHDREALAQLIYERGCRDVQFVPREALADFITREPWTGVVGFLGAGDIVEIASGVAQFLTHKGAEHAGSRGASVEA